MRDINSLNKVTLIGRLGVKPELRYLPQTERAVAKFTLATNERYFNPSTNESDIRTEWHRIVTWGKLAEFCEKYLNPGKQIYLEGKLRTRSWQDRDIQPKLKPKISLSLARGKNRLKIKLMKNLNPLLIFLRRKQKHLIRKKKTKTRFPFSLIKVKKFTRNPLV
jgi:single stranded DNA-binding protein